MKDRHQNPTPFPPSLSTDKDVKRITKSCGVRYCECPDPMSGRKSRKVITFLRPKPEKKEMTPHSGAHTFAAYIYEYLQPLPYTGAVRQGTEDDQVR